MNKRLEIIVFFSGAIGMVLELVGSRVLAPFFGNSMFVWTGLIGIILGSMSYGYYLGGRLADKKADGEQLSRILFIASAFVLLTAFVKEEVLLFIVGWLGKDLRISSLASIIVLFAPASVALGCVSPFAARIRLVDSKKAGSVVGNLYALSTVGSIAGTFLAGYYLIPFMGNSSLLYFLSVSLLMLSVLSSFKLSKSKLLLFFISAIFYYLNVNMGLFKLNVLADIDSLYNRILVRNTYRGADSVITLSIENFGSQSTVNPEHPEMLVSDYTNAYRIGNLLVPGINNALMLGGAGFTFPRYFIENGLGNNIDVVEIDSKMVDIARKYFFLKDDPRMKIFLTDARLFVKNTNKKYDVIYFDAFSSINPPYHLTTLEFMYQLRDLLTDRGIVMINMISSTTGKKSNFLEIEGNTLKKVFGEVDMFVIQNRPSDQVQNLMLVVYKGNRPEKITSDDTYLNDLISKRIYLEDRVSDKLVLTDDYAPVDYITRIYYENKNN